MTNSATIYHFLSLCLLYPEANLEQQLREAAAISNQAWPDALVEAFAGELLDTLQMEHTRLFVSNIKGVPCPPYESVYVDGRLLSATTAAVVAAYAEWGLEQSSETADFLPVELQFVAYLIELAGRASEKKAIEQARRQFEANHLKTWLPRFAADLQLHAGLNFYRQVGVQLARLSKAIK